MACLACCSSGEKTLSFTNWSDLEDLVNKVSDAVTRTKRDFPYNYDASAQYSTNDIEYTPAASSSAVADERQDGAGTDIVFQFPQTSVPELIVNLAPVSNDILYANMKILFTYKCTSSRKLTSGKWGRCYYTSKHQKLAR